MKESLTLYELNRLVSDTVSAAMPGEYWVEAEISEARQVHGHCYMELVQKEESTNTPVAKASAKCWRSVWAVVKPHFETFTGQSLHAGMKVRLQVYPQFHESYGFSWIVTGIDPSYTIGDMARRRQEIINILKQEGVFDLNKGIPIPMFAQRIAVISSPTAAGYGDFCNQLLGNAYGFHFTTRLFPATMQGEQTEPSIIQALDSINSQRDDFDCVVIIRGGGATSDLSGFDTLALAENVANFPLPVITGIGHDRDESILDMVSNTRVKTPTAAAAFLIDNLRSVAQRIDNAQKTITSWAAVLRERHTAILGNITTRLLAAANRRLSDERHRLAMLAQRISASNPEHLLRRGYSITLHNGKAVRHPGQLSPGDTIVTILEKGKIESVVK